MKEIRRILHLYDQLKADQTPAALAVVVAVAESSYRRVGARLLVAADGRYCGGISGGCLEGDALRRARTAILSGRPVVHVYDTTDGEDAVIGSGLGCEGRIDVLFQPLDYQREDNEVELLRELVDTRRPRLLLRWLTAAEGSDRPVMAFVSDNLQPVLELTTWEEAVLRAKLDGILESQRSRSLALPIVDQSTGLAVQERLFVEVLRPEIHLVVAGTNYDIPPVLSAARALGWRTTVIGHRRKFTGELASLADNLLDYGEANVVAPDAATAVVLMSHDFDRDREMAAHFLPLRPVYLGLLGPRKRARKMGALLAEEGLNLLGYPGLYAPVGLDIGAETPEEIAASLVTEIIAVFRGRAGQMLREREGAIHEREDYRVS